MIAELLEKFEDLFQPHDEETVKERYPIWTVTFASHTPSGESRKFVVKRVKVKAPEYQKRIAMNNAVESLEIKGARIKVSSGTLHSSNFHIHIREEDGVVDDKGRPMVGRYTLESYIKFGDKQYHYE